MSKEESITSVEKLKAIVPKLAKDAIDDFTKDFEDSLAKLSVSDKKNVLSIAFKYSLEIIEANASDILK